MYIGYLTITDIGNNGNGSDLQVAFGKATDEAKVTEYRIVVAKSGQGVDFHNLTSGQYLVVSKTGADQVVTLASTATDVDGALLTNNVPYDVYMVTVDGTTVQFDAIELGGPITLLQ